PGPGPGPIPTPANGFGYAVYDGTWDNLPNFDALTPIATGESGSISLGVTSQTDTFGLVFARTIDVATAGQYTFFTRSDDGSKLIIDGQVIVDNDGLHGARTRSGTVTLSPGQHDLRIEFFEKFGGQVLEVEYQPAGGGRGPIPSNGRLAGTGAPPPPPPPPGPVNGFGFSVYDGTWRSLPNFNGLTPIATGTSDRIDVGVTSQSETFGLVFTNRLQVSAAGRYTFTTNSDDGSRLYVDGQLVVDNDGLHGPRTRSGTVTLSAGAHSLRVEFFERFGGQVLDVTYQPPGGTPRAIPANGELAGGTNPGPGPAPTPNGAFGYAVYDGNWNVLPNFGALNPIATGSSNTIGVNVTSQTETFGLVFTNTLTVPSATSYTFRTRSDDGSRLYIDGQLVVDNDGLHGARTRSGAITLTPGNHALRVEFFEKFGGQVLEVNYQVAGGAFGPIPANGELAGGGSPGSGFAYSVYDGSWTVLPNFETLSPIVRGVSDRIGLNVTSQTETFGLVFTRSFNVPNGGNLEFRTSSDDGSKVIIDGVVVVDNDGLHATRTRTGTIFLAPGPHTLRVEFFELFGAEVLDVAYRRPGGTWRSIPATGDL
ncbi:MAG: PA14 domain-containing protein, partial [Pseudomonadota bacterium]